MAVTAQELDRMRAEFASRRNPQAYLPLCAALRRRRAFAEALDICQQALAQTPHDVAGRALFARLLADLGRYREALEEAQRAEEQHPGNLPLLAEKGRCLVKLHRFDEAIEVLTALELQDPTHPDVQLLRLQLRTSRDSGIRLKPSLLPRSQGSAPGLEELALLLKRQLTSLGRVSTIAVLDLDSGRSAVQGEARHAEVCEALYQDAAIACDELDQGRLLYLVVELDRLQAIIVRRGRRLVILCVDPAANFGKMHHRVMLTLDQSMPVADVNGSAATPA